MFVLFVAALIMVTLLNIGHLIMYISIMELRSFSVNVIVPMCTVRGVVIMKMSHFIVALHWTA